MWRKILVLALACFTPLKAQALDPKRAISQYAHTAWRSRDGYFASPPSTIAQTRDGYIWVGTSAGLLRFDGVRFTSWESPKGNPTLPSAYILTLFPSKDGSLWIGTAQGLARWRDGTLTDYSNASGHVHITSIQEDQEGHIWITRTRVRDGTGPLCELVGSKLRCYGTSDGIPEPQVTSLAIDPSGSIWIGGEGAMTRWAPQSAQTFHPLDGQRNVHTQIQALAATRGGGLWVGFFGSGHGLGLQSFERETWQPVTTGRFDGSSLGIDSLFIDSTNSLWVGTKAAGIYRIRGNSVEHFDASDGLSGDDAQSFFEDEEHNLWVATPTGIDCFRDLPVVSYTKREGLTVDQTNSVYAAGDGTVWLGLVGSLDAIREGVVSPVRTGKALPGSEVTTLLVDHTGRLWLGVDDELYLYNQGRFRRILDTKGKRSGMLTALAEDVDGSIWAGEQDPSAHQLLHIRAGVITEKFPEHHIIGVVADPHGGVWADLFDAIAHRQNGVKKLLKVPPGIRIDSFSDITSDRQGALWAVTRQGVLRFDADKVQLLGTSNGLPCAAHGSLIFDSQGSLWLILPCGIVRIDQSSLHDWLEHPETRVSTLFLDVFDGVQVGVTDFRPAVSLGRDGRLWFVNGSDVQMLDPAHLHINTFPPPVHIERLIADHEEVAITPATRVRSLTRDIEIDYTALSFVMPQRVRFRYKLEGHDGEWQDGGTRRSAFYTNLRPGTYTFLVTACNNSGVWNSQGTTLSFAILPAWYQTMWFRLLGLLLLALVSYALYLLRMRQYAAVMRARFNERLDERTQIARNLHDTLLQTIQGSKMVVDQARSDFSDPGKMESYLSRLSNWLDRASLEGRAALESLRMANSGTGDLGGSIRRGIEELQSKCSLDICLSVLGTPSEIHPVIRQEIFMIAYEAIGNACRHSRGQSVMVQLSYERGLRLRVSDDGCGIDAETLKAGKAGHFGLAGMRERAQRINATLNILSDSGKGTEIALIVPGKMIFQASRQSAASIFQKLMNRNRRPHTQSF